MTRDDARDSNHRLVVSLGGNAFAATDGNMSMAGQFAFAERTLAPLSNLLAAGRQLLITHGNGPQVGYTLTRVEESLGKAYPLPLEVCVAESEGEIGYVLQQTVHNLSHGRRPVSTLLTQVVVDERDPAFANPSKPIGPWFEPAHSDELERSGTPLVRDSRGRGRRIVPSPQPLEVIEAGIIEQMLALGIVVIAVGGGGIPVLRRGSQLEGVEAVIDKDWATAMLAIATSASQMILVTGVPGVYTSFEQAGQQLIQRTTAQQLQHLANAGEFPPGSMGPKVEAAVHFVRSTRRRAVICQARDLAAAIDGSAGTIVEPE